MAKHLSLDDRITIQVRLKERKSIAAIAKELMRDKATIVREVKSKKYYVHFKDNSSIRTKNACVHRYICNIKELCKNSTCFYKHKCCKYCGKCVDLCKKFEEEHCALLNESPHVCNGCTKKSKCTLSKWIYDAKKAQNIYEKALCESRQGVSLGITELEDINKIISPLLKKGQSIRNICYNEAEKIMISEKSVYTYLRKGFFDASLPHLSRTVQRKTSKKAGPPMLVDKKCREGRTYHDFEKFIVNRPDINIVEMDTVEGNRGGKVILTLFFRSCDLQLGFLRDRNTSESVTTIFEHLKGLLTIEEFKILFPVLLTDRGSEFSNPCAMEQNRNSGEILTKVFYCDPQNTNQKSRCERNHEYIRCIIPKGNSFNDFTQENISLMMNHINSYGRGKFNYKTPIELFETLYGSEITKKLGLKKISCAEVTLKPKLFK
jgi:IS30 family transposase